METIKKNTAVAFNAEQHTYTAVSDGHELSGVTPIIAWLFPETYAAVPQSVLDRAADRGHAVHAACQMADNLGLTAEDAPLAAPYLTLCEEAGLQPLANEYLVSDSEERIASQIDCVMQDADGLVLADIKTTSQLHRRHLAVQLSIYADLFEQQNPTLRVRRLAAIWLPKPVYGQPEIVTIPRLDTAPLQEAVRAYLRGEDAAPHRAALFPDEAAATDAALPAEVRDAEAAIIEIEESLRFMKERRAELETGLLALMKRHGVKKWDSPRIAITYVAPTKRKSLDSARLKAEYPTAYAACLRETETRESLRVTVKKAAAQSTSTEKID